MDSKYCYPSSLVLKNKFNIKDSNLLEKKERELTFISNVRIIANPIKGVFDLNYLQDIHKALFKDIYTWAGKIRVVDISKGRDFCYVQNIGYQAEYIFNQIKKDNYLKGLSIDKFSDRFGYYALEINMLHPFREGNGRSTREFLRSLAREAGYKISYSKIDKERLFKAFVDSYIDYSPLKKIFKDHIINNIINEYIKDIPEIENASERLLDKLQQLKFNLAEDSYISYKRIQEMYKDLEKRIDKGLINRNDKIFNIVSDIIMDIECRNSK